MQNIQCIYILNLKKDRERLKHCLMVLADEEIYIPIKIFDGTYWKTNEFENLYKNGIISHSNQWKEFNGEKINKGAVACCYSHFKLLQDAVNNNYQTILVLEDDVYSKQKGDLRKEIDKFHHLINKYDDFDMYYLGKVKVNSILSENKFRDTNFVESTYSWNSHSIIYSKECCIKLLNTKILSNIIPYDEFLPLCYGKSGCLNQQYFKKLFPKIITALASDTINNIHQVSRPNSRYIEYTKDWSITNIDDSTIL